MGRYMKNSIHVHADGNFFKLYERGLEVKMQKQKLGTRA